MLNNKLGVFIMDEWIDYSNRGIMDVLRHEVCTAVCEDTWRAATQALGVPDIDTECATKCAKTRHMIQQLEARVAPQVLQGILTRVRHALRVEQFSGLRARFDACARDIDAYLRVDAEEQRALFARLRDSGKDFYGQPITQEVYAFVLSQPGMISPVREGNRLKITAFPYDMVSYLAEDDSRRKRYHACHCPFARASILCEGEEVSPILCYCSLGHAKLPWDAIYGRDLQGELVTSALRGDDLCRYEIILPEGSL